MKKEMCAICLMLVLLTNGCAGTLSPSSGDWPENWDYIEATSGDELPSPEREKSLSPDTGPTADSVDLKTKWGISEKDLPKQKTPQPQSLTLEELQAKRLDMINRAIREGIFNRIEMPGTLPRLWVGPIFMNLDFKTKSLLVEIVYAYYFDRPGRKQSKVWGDSVRIYDMYTGKEIGSYSLGNWGGPLKLK